MKYECFIKPGFDQMDIEAESEELAKEIFRDIIRDNIGKQHVIANCLEDES